MKFTSRNQIRWLVRYRTDLSRSVSVHWRPLGPKRTVPLWGWSQKPWTPVDSGLKCPTSPTAPHWALQWASVNRWGHCQRPTTNSSPRWEPSFWLGTTVDYGLLVTRWAIYPVAERFQKRQFSRLITRIFTPYLRDNPCNRPCNYFVNKFSYFCHFMVMAENSRIYQVIFKITQHLLRILIGRSHWAQ